MLWAPPVIDELVHEPGNLTLLAEHFGDPPEEAVGLRTGVELTVQHLDLTDLVTADDGNLEQATAGTTGPIGAGVTVLLLWVVAVAGAVALRHRRLLRLHVVVAAGLVFATLSISRIFGSLWWYLMLWAWGLALLLALAVAWTAVAATSAWAPRTGPTLRRLGPPVLAAAVLASSLLFARDATDAEPPAPRLSAGLGALLPGTLRALEGGVAGADGRRGVYVVSWTDAVHIGSQAYGLVSELERRGYRTGMTKGLHVPLTRYRVIDPAEATVEIHFASGRNIEEFRSKVGAVEVAAADVRTPKEQAEFDRLRITVGDELADEGFDDVAGLLDDNLFAASIDPRLPRLTRERVARLVELGEPMAVFLAPAGTSL